MKITIYRNKHNFDKWLEVHEDGEGHRSVRQYIYTPSSGHVGLTGDGMLHRWRKEPFTELTDDYTRYASYSDDNPYFKRWFARKTKTDRSWYLRKIRRAK